VEALRFRTWLAFICAAERTFITREKTVKKLKLEAIQVESYETSAVPAEVGTVQANAATLSCPATCPRTCGATACVSCESSPWCC